MKTKSARESGQRLGLSETDYEVLELPFPRISINLSHTKH